MSKIDDILALIATQHLDIDTLETRNRDHLDFHDISVASIKKALHGAFIAGCEFGISNRAESESEICKYRQNNQAVDSRQEDVQPQARDWATPS